MNGSPKGRNAFSILAQTFRGYSWYFITLTVLGIATAAADGLSIASIIPMLSFLIPGSAATGGTVITIMEWIFGVLHIPFAFRYMVAFVAVLILARALLMALFVYLRALGNGRFLSDKIDELYTSLLNVRWQFALREKAGHLQNIVLWDSKRAAMLLDSIVQFLQSSSGFIVYLAVAIVISPLVTLVTIAAGAILVLMLRPLIQRTRRFSEESAGLEKELAQHVGEHVQGFKVVKAAGVIPEALDAARAYLSRFRDVMKRAVFVQSLPSIFIQPFGFLFAIAVFAVSYYSGTFNIAAFAAILYLIQKIFSYLDSTQSSFGTVVQYVPFAESIIAFKDRATKEREDDAAGNRPLSFEHDITFANVSLKHENGTEALAGISFSIRKREFVGIIGPSGSGKTSLADLLLRLFTQTSGEVRIDGVPVTDIRINEWRRAVGYVSQDSFLLHASIRDNIRFYDKSITDADIEHAADQAQLHDLIKSLPEGLDTILGDRGATLSGGQRQRVALARALARKPALLVLDEVTSALDSELETQIKEVIVALHSTVTLVVIAHRVSTVLDADTLIVLKDGHIEEQGPPQEMLARPNSYLSRIIELQGGRS